MPKPDKLPQPVTSPISKIWVQEYARAMKKLPLSARKRIESLLDTADVIDENIIGQIKLIIEKEVSPDRAKQIIEEFTSLFWQRGSAFAIRQLKRNGITVEIPFNLAILDDETLNNLKNLQLDLVKGLSEDLKKKIAYELREGLLQGESIRELRDRIRKVVDIGRSRAETIARTESARVFNQAALTRYNNAGIKKWRWMAAMDERTCPVCMERHGKTFSNPADLPPHASHPNCRCTIVPEIPKEKPPEQPKEAKPEPTTGNPEIDDKISKTLDEFEKVLKEDGSFVRSVNRVINGKQVDLVEAEKIYKRVYGKHIKGASKQLKEHLRTKLATRINPKVLEKTNPVRIVNKKRGRSFYDPTEKKISLVTAPEELQWRRFLHEYGHHLEHELYRREVAEFYLARVRKNGYKLESLGKLYNYKLPFGEDEYAFVGFDVEPYAGKFYGGEHRSEHYKVLRQVLENPKRIEEFKDKITTEVLSVGLEKFENEATMKSLYENDRELFGFILSLLRGDFL